MFRKFDHWWAHQAFRQSLQSPTQDEISKCNPVAPDPRYCQLIFILNIYIVLFRFRLRQSFSTVAMASKAGLFLVSIRYSSQFCFFVTLLLRFWRHGALLVTWFVYCQCRSSPRTTIFRRFWSFLDSMLLFPSTEWILWRFSRMCVLRQLFNIWTRFSFSVLFSTRSIVALIRCAWPTNPQENFERKLRFTFGFLIDVDR